MDLPLPRSLKDGLQRLILKADSGAPEAIGLCEDLEHDLLTELSSFGFFAVPPSRTDFYDSGPEKWFSLKARQKFSSAERDMRDACQCFALAQWTASVFHSMRVLELVFRALARHVNATLKEDLDYADWAALSKAVQKKIDEEHQKSRGKAKTEELEFLARCALDLDHFGDAWRHSVCHARGQYDDRIAREVLDQVRALTERLAARMQ